MKRHQPAPLPPDPILNFEAYQVRFLQEISPLINYGDKTKKDTRQPDADPHEFESFRIFVNPRRRPVPPVDPAIFVPFSAVSSGASSPVISPHRYAAPNRMARHLP